MAQNPGALKRQKELARLEWQAEKAAKRKQKAAENKREDEAPNPPSPVVNPPIQPGGLDKRPGTS